MNVGKLSRLVERLEDAYYSFLDFLMERGVPVDRIVGPLEERGIRTFVIFYGVVLLLLLGVGWTAFNFFVVPKHVFYFTDAYGNPLEGVKATFVVDGERVVFYSDAEGKVVVEGRDVEFVSAVYPGYSLRGREEAEDGLRVVLEPKRYRVKVKIRDGDGTPLSATLRVYVDGSEVFSETGSDFELCFSEAEAKGCIVAESDSEIEFVTEKEGYGEKRKTYSLGKLPDAVVLTLQSKESIKEEVVEQKMYASVVFSVRFEGLDEPVDGTLYVAPQSSPSTGTPVRIKSGLSSPVRLALGTYKVVSAQVLVKKRYVSVEVVNGSTFVVEKDSTIEIVVKPPEDIFTLRIEVVDKETEDPLVDAKVVFSYGDKKVERTTNEAGEATIEVGEEACGTVSVSKEKYEPASKEACTGEEVLIELNRIVEKGNVRVVVYGPTGDPLPNATVYLLTTDGGESGFEGTTNLKGEVEFEGVPVGTYVAVAEFLSVSLSSYEFNVEKDKTVEVPIYFTQESTTLVVSVKKKGQPVLGADVKVYDVRGYLLFEGTTGFEGEVSGEVPPLVGVEVEVNYLGSVIKVGPFPVPGGVSTYTVEVNIPEETDPYAKFLEVVNEEGEKVGSLKRGNVYYVTFEVGYEGSGSFVVAFPEGVEVEAVSPEGTVEEDKAIVSLSSSGYSVVRVTVKFKLKYSFTEDLLFVSYSLDSIEGETAIPVGQEYTCGEYVCFLAVLRDPEGVEVKPGDTLNLLEEYNLSVYVIGDVDEEVELSLVKESVQGDEEVLATQETLLSKTKPFVFRVAFQPLVEEGIIFRLRVSVAGSVLEDLVLGSWPVYVPDLGLLFLEYNVVDVETNTLLPKGWFLEGRKQRIEYVVFDENLGDPLTPTEFTVYCGGVPYKSAHGSRGEIHVTPKNCEEMELVASAPGYEDREVVLSRIGADTFEAEIPQKVELNASRVVVRKIKVLGPVDANLYGEGSFEECEMNYIIRGKEAYFRWSGNKCKGLVTDEVLEANLYHEGLLLGQTEVKARIAYGRLRDCLYAYGKSFDVKDWGFLIEAEIKNGCSIPVKIDADRVKPIFVGIDPDNFQIDVNTGASGEVNLEPGSALPVIIRMKIDEYTPSNAGGRMYVYLSFVANGSLISKDLFPGGRDVSFESLCLDKDSLLLIDIDTENITLKLNNDFKHSFCSWGGQPKIRAYIQDRPQTLTHWLVGEVPIVFDGVLRVYMPKIYLQYIEVGDETLWIMKSYSRSLLDTNADHWKYSYGCEDKNLSLFVGGTHYNNIIVNFGIKNENGYIAKKAVLLKRLIEGVRIGTSNGNYDVEVNVFEDDEAFVPATIKNNLAVECGSGTGGTYLKDKILLDTYEYDQGYVLPRSPAEFLSLVTELEPYMGCSEEDGDSYVDLYQVAMLLFEAVYDKACKSGVCNFGKLDESTLLEGLPCADQGEDNVYRLNIKNLILFDLNGLNDAPGIEFNGTRKVVFEVLELAGKNLTVDFNTEGLGNGLIKNATLKINHIDPNGVYVRARITGESLGDTACDSCTNCNQSEVYDCVVHLSAKLSLYDDLLMAMLRPFEKTNKIVSNLIGGSNVYSFDLNAFSTSDYYLEGYCFEGCQLKKENCNNPIQISQAIVGQSGLYGNKIDLPNCN